MINKKTLAPRDKVLIEDINGKLYKATIINVNEFREPCMKYVVELDEYSDMGDLFIGEDSIVSILDGGEEQ